MCHYYVSCERFNNNIAHEVCTATVVDGHIAQPLGINLSRGTYRIASHPSNCRVAVARDVTGAYVSL